MRVDVTEAKHGPSEVGFVATNEALLLERLPKASEHGSVSLRMSLSVLSLTSCLLEVSPSAVADMEALVTQTSVGDEAADEPAGILRILLSSGQAWLYVFGHMPTNVLSSVRHAAQHSARRWCMETLF